MTISAAAQGPMVNFNGNLMHANQVHLGPYHPAVMFGQGVYDAVFAPQGRPFFIDRHFDRLFYSAKAAGWQGPSLDQWKSMVGSMIQAFGEKDVIVYMQISPGQLPYQDFGKENERELRRPNGPIDAWAMPLQAQWLLPTQATLEQGIALSVQDEVRHDLQHVKTTSLFATGIIKEAAIQAGSADALIVGRDGSVKENTAANTHMVMQGADGRPVVVTPAKGGLLEGIRIPIIAELCAEAGIAHERRAVPIDEAKTNATELLVTSATRGVIPATKLDGQPVGTGEPGPVFKALRAGYDRLLERVVATQPFGVVQ